MEAVPTPGGVGRGRAPRTIRVLAATPPRRDRGRSVSSPRRRRDATGRSAPRRASERRRDGRRPRDSTRADPAKTSIGPRGRRARSEPRTRRSWMSQSGTRPRRIRRGRPRRPASSPRHLARVVRGGTRLLRRSGLCGNQPLARIRDHSSEIRQNFAEMFSSTPVPRCAQKKCISTFGYRAGSGPSRLLPRARARRRRPAARRLLWKRRGPPPRRCAAGPPCLRVAPGGRAAKSWSPWTQAQVKRRFASG